MTEEDAMKAQDSMTRDVITVTPTTPIHEVAALMAKQKVHTIPVVEGEKLVGIIGKMDLVRGMAREPGE